MGGFIWNMNSLASEWNGTNFARLCLKLVLRIDILNTSCDIGDNRKSILMQVVAWCRQETSLPELMLTRISVAIWLHITTDLHSYSSKVYKYVYCMEPEFNQFTMLDCRTLSLKFSHPFLGHEAIIPDHEMLFTSKHRTIWWNSLSVPLSRITVVGERRY